MTFHLMSWVSGHPERVDRYAELYRTEAAAFSFGDPDALSSAHALPKL